MIQYLSEWNRRNLATPFSLSYQTHCNPLPPTFYDNQSDPIDLFQMLFYSFGLLFHNCIFRGRLARWRKWRACDAGKAKQGLENELWRRWSNVGKGTEVLENELWLRWSNGKVGEWALQRTHLQRPLLRMSPTAGDETSRGRKPENGRRRDFGRRRRHRQSGFQHTDRPRPSSPELFNKDDTAGRESLSHLTTVCLSV